MSASEPTQLGLPFESTSPRQQCHDRGPESGRNGESLVVATWNVNSIRARLELVVAWLKNVQPDVLCLQETKVSDELFPHEVFAQLGYQAAVHGQPRYNGVALLSRVGLAEVKTGLGEGQETEARIVAASTGGVRVASIYAPNAYSTTDSSFASKIDWLRRLAGYVRSLREEYRAFLLCGDFNVTPRDSDLHNATLWLYSTFVHPDGRNALRLVIAEGLMDLHLRVNGDAVAYTWWDYRHGAVSRNDGIRIDHIYASDLLAARCTEVFVDVGARRAEKPSDHAPIVARFKLADFQAGVPLVAP